MSRKKIIGNNTYQSLTTDISNYMKQNISNNIYNQESNRNESDNEDIKRHRRNLTMDDEFSKNITDYNNKSINITSPQIIYDQIKAKLEKIISIFYDKNEILCEILTEIVNAINFTLDNFSSYSERSSDLFLTQTSKSKLSIESKIIYLLKIQKLEQEIKNLKEKLDFFYSIYNKSEPNSKIKYLSTVFKKKFDEQKILSRKKEFEYLFFLEEQGKKINELEKKLLSKENINYDKDAIKSIRCFPNYKQYEMKEHINPKSIPLYKKFHKLKLNSDRRCKASSLFNLSKITHNKSKKIKQKSSEKIFNNHVNKDSSHKTCMSTNCNKRGNIENDFTNRSKNGSKQPLSQEKLKKNYIEDNFSADEYRPKTILDNNKEFFISHPKLEIAGYPNKKEVRYEGLPKKILRFKLHKHLEKSLVVSFPSSVNETLVNLEKLRKK